MTTVAVRPLTPGDASAFREIRLEALEQVPQAFAESAEEFRNASVESIAAHLGNMSANNFLLGAFDGPELIGTAGFGRGTRLKHQHKGRVWGVYVRSSRRGGSVGRQLVTELVRLASLLPGVEQIILSVGAEQTAAKALYSSLGFEVFGRERRALKIGDSYVDEDYMVLSTADARGSG